MIMILQMQLFTPSINSKLSTSVTDGFVLGDCVAQGNKPEVTITNTGYINAYYQVQYSTNVASGFSQDWNNAFPIATIGPNQTNTFIFTEAISQFGSVALRFRHAPSVINNDTSEQTLPYTTLN